MTIRIYRQLLVISLSYFSISCTPPKRDVRENDTTSVSSSSPVQEDTLMLKKVKLFKSWLTDTLSMLDSQFLAHMQAKDIVKTEIVIAPDSLGLTIVQHYEATIKHNLAVNASGYTKNLLDLLMEYDEFPKTDFRVKFDANKIYSPSPVPELAYGFSDELGSIEVTESNGRIVSQYAYVRGRLSYKTVVRKEKNGKYVEEHVDFDWDDNKLIKKGR